jgi:hypothetical protein
MAKSGAWIFIEEPELNIHPGMQHLFLNTILKNEIITNKKLKFFLTTHSNHLLNLSLPYTDQISIFSFEKVSLDNESKTKIRKVSGQDINLLDLLGVYNASVFMSNCSIWLEGITDRRIITAYLKAYTKSNNISFQEDSNYSFFLYAGSNLAHYMFSKDEDENSLNKKRIQSHFITNKIFLLVDRDSANWKQKRNKEFELIQNDKFEFSTTGAIEIENTISPSIISKFLKSKLKIEASIVDKFISNNSSYKSKGLGTVLNEINNYRGMKRKFTFTELGKSGTLSTDYKNKLSTFIINEVDNGSINWNEISKNSSAKKIAERIYRFIKKHNANF